MSDLRFFADFTHEQIKLEARLRQIEANAKHYAERCEQERRASLPYRFDRPLASFHKANEGLCAVKIILKGEA